MILDGNAPRASVCPAIVEAMSHPSNHPSNKITLDNVDDLFTYHSPTAEQIPRFKRINKAAHALAVAILTDAPDCADRSSALRLVRQARMEANSAIANEPHHAGASAASTPKGPQFAFVINGEDVPLAVEATETFASARARALAAANMSHRPAEDYEIRDGLGRLIEPTLTFDPVLTVNAQAIDIRDRHHKFFISLRVGVGG